MQFAREGLGWLLETSVPPNELAGQLANFYFECPPETAHSESHEALDRLLKTRNAIQHKRRSLNSEAQIASACEETYADLVLVLRSLSFLENYNLDYVDSINVKKRRRQLPKFTHGLKRMRGDPGCFRGKDDSSINNILENRSVLFRHSRSGEYLNLDPLLVHEEKAGSAEDLFFFNGMNGSASIHYAACKQGGNFNSSTCVRRDELDEEMQILLNVLAPAKEASHGE